MVTQWRRAAIGLILTTLYFGPAYAGEWGGPYTCVPWYWYEYWGHFFAMRWPPESSDQMAVFNSTAEVTTEALKQAADVADLTWRLQGNLWYKLPELAFSLSFDQSNSYVAFISDQNWRDLQLHPDGAGFTYQILNSDTTMAHARTVLHVKSTWGWSTDCLAQGQNCSPNPQTGWLGRHDLPTILLHEAGHWWGLGNSPDEESCAWAVMYGRQTPNIVNTTLSQEDIDSARDLYDQMVGVGSDFSASPGPGVDTLRWTDSDPSSSGPYYYIYVGPDCWGPMVPDTIVPVIEGEPWREVVVPVVCGGPHFYRIAWIGGGGTCACVSNGGACESPGVATSGSVTIMDRDFTGVSDSVRWNGSWAGGTSFSVARIVGGVIGDCDGQYNATLWQGLTLPRLYDEGVPYGEVVRYYGRGYRGSSGTTLQVGPIAQVCSLCVGYVVPMTERVVVCPGGDGDSVTVDVFAGACVGGAGRVGVVRTDGGGVRLWSESGESIAPGDTVWADMSGVVWHVGVRRGAGCGLVSWRVVAGGWTLADSVGIDVDSFAFTDSCPGYVSRFDEDRLLDAWGTSDVCADLSGDGVVGTADLSMLVGHLGHHVPQTMSASSPGGAFAQGGRIPVHWQPTIGGATKVSVMLTRDGYPGLMTPLAWDCADDGSDTCTVFAADAPRSDYRIKVVWTAGPYEPEGGNIIDSALSDSTFKIDPVPPAAVVDLTVEALGRTTEVVMWTAPGDDSLVGRASEYDLRYSTAPITASNFGSATPVTVAAPDTAGTVECAEVSSLSQCTTYYFALKTADVAGNWSGLSNVPNGKTRCTGWTEVTCDEEEMMAQGESADGWVLEGPVLDIAGDGDAEPYGAQDGPQATTAGGTYQHAVDGASEWRLATTVTTDTCRLDMPLEVVGGQVRVRLSPRGRNVWRLGPVELKAVDRADKERAYLSGDSVAVGWLGPLAEVIDGSTNLAAALSSGREFVTALPGSPWDVTLGREGTGARALLMEVVGGVTGEGAGEGIRVLAPDSQGVWQTLANLMPGRGTEHLVVESVPGNHLRLVFGAEYGVRRLARLDIHSHAVLQDLGPVSAIHSQTGSVLSNWGASTDSEVVVGPHEALVLSYKCPVLAGGQARDYFLVARGRRLGTVGQANSRPATPPARPLDVPTSFSLYQNRPNPFRGATSIRFDLPVPCNVRLEVFDMQGRRVRTLADGPFSAGFQSVPWDQRSASGSLMKPGVYLYRLQANSFREQKRMVLLP